MIVLSITKGWNDHVRTSFMQCSFYMYVSQGQKKSMVFFTFTPPPLFGPLISKCSAILSTPFGQKRHKARLFFPNWRAEIEPCHKYQRKSDMAAKNGPFRGQKWTWMLKKTGRDPDFQVLFTKVKLYIKECWHCSSCIQRMWWWS